jgi:endoglycosylceramidase
VVLLRGVNAAGDSKIPPFTPLTDPAAFDPLQRWGLNVVRLLFTWEAYEPEPGSYDAAYLDYYVAAARAAWARGLYVIVDFHQDAFSRFSIGGCGEGFPRWALPASVIAHEPDNGPDCKNWGIRMQTDEDLPVAFAAFHANEGGVRMRYLAMIETVAEALAGEPGVIGYDIINEPHGDEASELAVLYEDAGRVIRQEAPDAILFISPRANTSAGLPTELPILSLDNLAYAPHYYDVGVVAFGGWSGTPPDEPFGYMLGTASDWGVPLFLGEFGAPPGSNRAGEYVDELYHRLDGAFASGAQWVYTPGWTEERKDGWNVEDFSIVDDQGRLRDNFVPRPYPQRIAGTPTALDVVAVGDPKARSMAFMWEHDPSLGGTEIFVPREAFFGTAEVALETEGDGLTCELGDLVAVCSSAKAGPMTVRARAKPAAARGEDDPTCGLFGIELLLVWPLCRRGRRRAR